MGHVKVPCSQRIYVKIGQHFDIFSLSLDILIMVSFKFDKGNFSSLFNYCIKYKCAIKFYLLVFKKITTDDNDLYKNYYEI